MDRRASPAKLGVVHNIVVDQRKTVEHFNRRCRIERREGVAADCAARQKQKHRTDALASPCENVPDRAVD